MVITAEVDDSNVHDEGQPDWNNALGIAKVFTEWQPLSAALQNQLGLSTGEQRYKVFLQFPVSPGVHRLRVQAPLGVYSGDNAAPVERVPVDDQPLAGKFGNAEYAVIQADWWTSHTRAIVELIK